MLAVALYAVAALNLTCTGTSALIHNRLRDSHEFQLTIRVDPAAGQWCIDDCGEVKPIVSASDTEIIFEQSRDEAAGITREHRVNLESGAYMLNFDVRIGPTHVATTREGRCVRAPFTGIESSK